MYPFNASKKHKIVVALLVFISTSIFYYSGSKYRVDARFYLKDPNVLLRYQSVSDLREVVRAFVSQHCRDYSDRSLNLASGRVVFMATDRFEFIYLAVDGWDPDNVRLCINALSEFLVFPYSGYAVSRDFSLSSGLVEVDRSLHAERIYRPLSHVLGFLSILMFLLLTIRLLQLRSHLFR